MWNSSRGFAGRWFARQRLAGRMPTEDSGVAGHTADSAWRVRMGALEPSYLSVCPSGRYTPGAHRLEAAAQGMWGQGGSRHGGSNLDCVS